MYINSQEKTFPVHENLSDGQGPFSKTFRFAFIFIKLIKLFF